MDVRVLGTVEVRVAGRPVVLRRRQGRLLVGILALEATHVITCDRLVDLLWGDHPPSRARGVVHSRMSELRTALAQLPDAGRLRAEQAGYVLDIEPEQVDAHRFLGLLARARETTDAQKARMLLREALDLWRGPVLDGQLGPTARTSLCQGLESARLAAEEDQLDIELRLGRHAEIVDQLVQLAMANPTRERLVGQMMVALHREGRTAEALGRYDRWRRWLGEEFGVDPGSDIQRLHVAILRNDPELPFPTRVNGDGMAASAAAAIVSRAGSFGPPHELPADTGCFVGREEEARELRKALIGQPSPHRPAVAVIYGEGGVGKSALAIHLAHDVGDQFPDGQLHVDLCGMTPGLRPLTPADTLRWMLGSLGFGPDEVPPDEEQAAARFRTVTADRRILVVLDNAFDAAQVCSLLPASGTSAVVITSRRALSTLDADIRLHLDGLTGADSVALLRRLAPMIAVDQEIAESIAQVCDHLPLALRIAAGRLTGYPSVPPAELANRLADSRRRLDELELDGLAVRSCIRVGYEALAAGADPKDQLAARIFRALGSLNLHDVVVETVAVMLAEPDVSLVGTALDHLAAVQLLVRGDDGRYRFHDLVRLVAIEQAALSDAVERDESVRRTVKYYLSRLQAAAHQLWPGRRPIIRSVTTRRAARSAEFPDAAEASSWLDHEFQNLLTIAERAGGVEPDGWRDMVRIGGLLFLRMHNRLEWHAGRRLAARTRELTERKVPDGDELLAHAYLMIGRFEAEVGAHASAMAHFEQARVIFARSEDLVGIGQALVALAIVADYSNDVDHMVTYARECMAHAVRHGLVWLEASASNNLGMCFARQRRWAEALPHFEHGLAIRRKQNDRVGIAIILSNIAALRCMNGHLDEVWPAIAEVHACAHAIDDRRHRCNAMLIGAEARLRAGDHQQAMAEADAALSLARTYRDVQSEAFALRQLARAMSAGGDSAAARRLEEQAAEAFGRLARRPDPVLEGLIGTPTRQVG